MYDRLYLLYYCTHLLLTTVVWPFMTISCAAYDFMVCLLSLDWKREWGNWWGYRWHWHRIPSVQWICHLLSCELAFSFFFVLDFLAATQLNAIIKYTAADVIKKAYFSTHLPLSLKKTSQCSWQCFFSTSYHVIYCL